MIFKDLYCFITYNFSANFYLWQKKTPLKPEAYFAALSECYAQFAQPEQAMGMAAYMKNHFPFLGIKTPERRELSAGFIAEHDYPRGEELKTLCRLCFAAPQRELQYFVNDLLRKRVKHLGVDFLDLFEELIGQKSWWDTVDFIAPHLAGALFKRFPEYTRTYTQRWIDSPNIWYQRAAIIFQLDYKDKTDAELLFEYIQKRSDSKEFFVQKGAGWALRQYARVNPEGVKDFVADTKLPALTVREALRRIG